MIPPEVWIEFENKLWNYWQVEARDDESGSLLKTALNHPDRPISLAEFRRCLAHAIQTTRYSAEGYESLTGVACDTDEDVVTDLGELWQLLFGKDPLSTN